MLFARDNFSQVKLFPIFIYQDQENYFDKHLAVCANLPRLHPLPKPEVNSFFYFFSAV